MYSKELTETFKPFKLENDLMTYATSVILRSACLSIQSDVGRLRYVWILSILKVSRVNPYQVARMRDRHLGLRCSFMFKCSFFIWRGLV